MDYDETTKQACSREIKEETNLSVDLSILNFLWIDSEPKGEKQNIHKPFPPALTDRPQPVGLKMAWVQRMKSIRNRVEEIVRRELVEVD